MKKQKVYFSHIEFTLLDEKKESRGSLTLDSAPDALWEIQEGEDDRVGIYRALEETVPGVFDGTTVFAQLEAFEDRDEAERWRQYRKEVPAADFENDYEGDYSIRLIIEGRPVSPNDNDPKISNP